MATYSKVLLSGQPYSYPTLVTATSTSLASGIYVTSVASPTTTTATVTTATLTAPSNVITYTTSASHSFVVGQLITITGLSGTNSALANLANIIITSVPSATTFTASVPYSPALSVALTTQTGTATSYNALYSYTYSTNAQIFAATQLVSVTGLTTVGYNVGSSPILSVSTLATPTSTTYSFGFTVSVPSTLTTTLSAQAGTATALPLTGTFIHNNTGTGLDEVWLYATNLTSAAVVLSLSFGAPQLGVTPFTPELMNITIPGNSGLTLVTPGLILSNNASSTANSAVYAYASVANAIAISGYVNRIA